MPKTKKPNTAKRISYRRRLKMSACRGKAAYVCAAKPGCKYTRGKQRKYCRKTKNTPHAGLYITPPKRTKTAVKSFTLRRSARIANRK